MMDIKYTACLVKWMFYEHTTTHTNGEKRQGIGTKIKFKDNSCVTRCYGILDVTVGVLDVNVLHMR